MKDLQYNYYFRMKVKKEQKGWYYGTYHQHINRQLAPIGDCIKPEDVENVFITDGFADWNMPKDINVFREFDVSSIGRYTGFSNSRIRFYENDIIEFNYYGVLTKGLIVFDETGTWISLSVQNDKNELIKIPLYIIYKESMIIGNSYDNEELYNKLFKEVM